MQTLVANPSTIEPPRSATPTRHSPARWARLASGASAHSNTIIRLSLVVPAHNEEKRLAATLETYSRALSTAFGDAFEIIVVSNGSRDQTANVARTSSRTLPRVRLIEITEPLGKGGAVLEGFRHARGRCVAFADADGATTARSIIELAQRTAVYDVVIGSRRMPGSVITCKQPLRRRLCGKLFSWTARRLFRLPYADTQCGAKAFRRAAAQQLAARVRERTWSFDLDLLLTARELGLSVAEYPVTWADRPGSRLHLVPTIRDVVSSFWRMARRRAASPVVVRRPLRILACNWRCIRHPQTGGAEVNLFEQARRWVRDGHSVTVLTADPGRAVVPQRNEVVDGIDVRRRGGRFSVYLATLAFVLRHSREYDVVLDVANGVPFFTPLVSRRPVTLLVHHVHDSQWFSEFPRPVAI